MAKLIVIGNIGGSGDDGRSPLRSLAGVRFFRPNVGGAGTEKFVFLESRIDDFEAQLAGQGTGGLDVYVLIHRDHRAQCHELALELRGLDAERLGEFADRDLALDPNRPLQLGGNRHGLLRRGVSAARARVDRGP